MSGSNGNTEQPIPTSFEVTVMGDGQQRLANMIEMACIECMRSHGVTMGEVVGALHYCSTLKVLQVNKALFQAALSKQQIVVPAGPVPPNLKLRN